jgi:transcriptional regulator with GAF, ATPase, and Fis domain
VTAKPEANEKTVSGQSTLRESPSSARLGERPMCLTVVHSPDAASVGKAAELSAGSELLAVGRDVAEQGLCARDPRMSRTHFRVVWDGRARVHRLGDAGSANGTFVNGVRAESAPLSAGDVVRAGETLFVYQGESSYRAALERALLIASSELSVLLCGETGTGKELLARRIHQHSGRSGPLVPLNCATVAGDLISAELFGHTRGAFSGATSARPGLFRAAEGGTLFLDEIADLPLEVQPALLRALQERRVRPVGAEAELAVDVRIVAAAQSDLSVACQEGRFREDLRARLAQVVVRVPPLRERREQLLELFAEFAAGRFGVSTAAAEALLLWRWPHNVRELESLVGTFAVLAPGAQQLDVDFLRENKPEMLGADEPALARPGAPATGSDSRDRRTALGALLQKHQWNIAAVARDMGKTRAQIYRWIKAYGLRSPDSR